MKTIKELIEKVKQKKELFGLSDRIVRESLQKHLGSKKDLRKSEAKLIVKLTRAELRLLSGQFQASQKERVTLLKENKIQELLETHSSTKERLEFYPQIKKLIASLKIKSILDLGCGLNPLALANKSITYYAADIKQSELTLIKSYFKSKGIKGKTFFYDLRKIKPNLPKADLCLLLKVFDVIEKRGHKLAEKIINSIDCKYFLISFPTKTLSGKPMRHPQRGWIEQLLNRLEFQFKSLRSPNEIFYLAKKRSSSS